jgi:hypothetical protein
MYPPFLLQFLIMVLYAGSIFSTDRTYPCGTMFIVSCPVVIEVDLKVKGTNDSADECLSFQVAQVV